MKTRAVAWCLGMAALLASLTTAHAAPPGPLTFVTSLLLDKPALDLVVEGDYAYVGTDVGVTIVNIRNPVAPAIVGQVSTGGQVMGLALKWPYLYLANRSKDFQVVNVQNPAAPSLVATATRILPSYSWDVAVKGNVAYVANFAGELYLFDITDPTNPEKFGVLGILEWNSPGLDAQNVARMEDLVAAGNAKATGVSITGNTMVVAGWNYGISHYYDVSTPEAPVFRGTHIAPFMFRGEVAPGEDAAYVLAAFGTGSGLYSVTLPIPDPPLYSRSSSCTGCDYFKTVATNYGGLAVSPNGNYVVLILGKVGEVRVLDVSNPGDIKEAPGGVLPIPAHGAKTGEPMGVAIKGNVIFTAAGILGLRVYSYDGLSN